MEEVIELCNLRQGQIKKSNTEIIYVTTNSECIMSVIYSTKMIYEENHWTGGSGGGGDTQMFGFRGCFSLLARQEARKEAY